MSKAVSRQNQAPFEVPDNLGSTVYHLISEALIQGRLRPGERLKIRELAEKLGTSVTPVRDAILRLVQEQALEMKSPRDIRVPHMTLQRYLEIRAIRVKLEGLAAETAAARATAADIARLQDLVARNNDALARGDHAAGCDLNQQFHFALVDIAGMPFLGGILSRIWLQMGPLISAAYAAGGQDMIDYHPPLIAALQQGDGPAAARAIGDDIVSGGHAILLHLQAQAGA
ncbi:GntR family transcriptional regulator [Vogesella sp. LIG4]|uniref:GntR family transcriptional regulator n=1 Tax=Vogesella sp. LIG4 TaxID=1192162 RepID=UPI00081F933A|nr:GntR family transcriptional regulator [Vogesella sp. LIG4]SCK16645.1 DNA-binding transcriptional regulator, GntR family [Vogesella sp. LIG4]